MKQPIAIATLVLALLVPGAAQSQYMKRKSPEPPADASGSGSNSAVLQKPEITQSYDWTYGTIANRPISAAAWNAFFESLQPDWSVDDFQYIYGLAVAEAHGELVWPKDKNLHFDFALSMKGQPNISGSAIKRAPRSPVVATDAPDDADVEWLELLSLPYLLREPTAIMANLGLEQLDGNTVEAALLLPEYETAYLSPWYVTYKKPLESRLDTVAFEYDGAAFEGEWAAARYVDYQKIEGVFVPQALVFYDWSEDDGVGRKELGRLELENIRFEEKPTREEKYKSRL